MFDSDFLDIANSPNDFFDNTDESLKEGLDSQSSNSNSYTPNKKREGEYGSVMHVEIPKIKLLDSTTGTKFKRNT